jgi:hypothetical protein
MCVFSLCVVVLTKAINVKKYIIHNYNYILNTQSESTFTVHTINAIKICISKNYETLWLHSLPKYRVSQNEPA